MRDKMSPSRPVGRDSELARIRSIVERAVGGESGAVVVSGEAGIGKTLLCRSAAAGTDGPIVGLVVTCMPLQALSTGLAPLRTAIRTSSASTALIRACLERIDAADPIRAVDDWVAGVVAEAPLVVLVDDVQWADPSLRDVLLYLLAGPRNLRLAILITARTTGLSDGHPLYRWLADVLRFPQASQLELGPLNRAATEALVADLLGDRPHQSLVEDVFRAGGGNPFLTSLLVRDADASARHLPARHPADLTTAVRGVWHGCSPPTRALMCLLAVAGGPQQADLLASMAHELGLEMEFSAAIDEAEAAGLVQPVAGSRYWFRHPLQAEVLERSVPQPERRRWQAAYARRGDQLAAAGDGPTLEAAIAQSVHHDQAGSASAAYRWALRAWEIGRGRPLTLELRRVLRRAVDLRPQVPEATERPEDLWERCRFLAADAGAYGDELEAVEALILSTDETRQPLRLSELLIRRMLLRVTAAIEFFSIDDVSRAVRLAAVDQASWQYGLALAELAHVLFWRDDPGASSAAAERALAVARAGGEPMALSYALTASAMVELSRGRPAATLSLAAEAVDAATAARDWWAYVHAVMWESNALPEPFGHEAAAYLRRRRQQLSALGGPEPYVLMLAAVESELYLELGNWQTCDLLLREAVIADPGPMADLRIRCTIARLAAYQGRVTDARAHLDRALDLIGGQPQYRNLSLDVTRATVLLEARRPAEAFRVALAAAAQPGVPVDMAERLLPLAARALADQAEEDRDHQRSDCEHLEALADLREQYPQVIDDGQTPGLMWQQRLTALQEWYDAETARARQSTDEPDLWISMRASCALGQLPWLEAYACWRAAETLLSRGSAGRTEGIRMLRAGYDLAGRLAADGIRAQLDDLGRLAHAKLGPRDAAPILDGARLRTLTPREREILGYLVQGLTYSEIARALVISEKTVSSHISNLLRKTNTSSRFELARVVNRIENSA